MTAPESGSFRDPYGQVFIKGDEVFRFIFNSGKEDFEQANSQGILRKIIEKGYLIPYEIIDPPDFAPEKTVVALKHPKLPMISYPWEWPFSLLKDAAIIHLDLMKELLEHSFWLRDASAFNIQFDGKKPFPFLKKVAIISKNIL